MRRLDATMIIRGNIPDIHLPRFDFALHNTGTFVGLHMTHKCLPSLSTRRIMEISSPAHAPLRRACASASFGLAGSYGIESSHAGGGGAFVEVDMDNEAVGLGFFGLALITVCPFRTCKLPTSHPDT